MAVWLSVERPIEKASWEESWRETAEIMGDGLGLLLKGDKALRAGLSKGCAFWEGEESHDFLQYVRQWESISPTT